MVRTGDLTTSAAPRRSVSVWARRSGAAIGLAAALALGLPALAGATTFTVNGTGDGTGACAGSSCPTLRSAVLASNATAGPNTITVPAGNYTLTLTPTGADNGLTGDLHITTNVTINGAGAGAGGTTITGDGDRIFDISAASVTLSGLGMTGGSQEQFGAAIKMTGAALTLTNDAFTGNTTTSLGFGGAVYDQASGSASLTVSGSTFTSNIAADSGSGGGGFGGAISFEPGGAGTLTVTNSEFDSNTAQTGATSGGGFGGAIDFEPSSSSTLTVSGSTFSGNNAAGSSSQGGFGGGIEFEPGNNSSLTVTNSTLTGNVAGGASGFGGAISFEPGSGSSLAISNSTIVGNSASRANQGGGLDIEDSPATITNSIVSANTAGGATNNCEVSPPATLTLQGHNIELGTTCGFDINANPAVGPLANNGGPTKTMALLAGSPAIDAASPAFCPATDQRGVARPDQPGTPCDIGAFEFGQAAPPPPSPPANTAPPQVSGTPEPGHVLTCSTGKWSGSPTGFVFKWRRAGVAIAGANSAHYTVQILDEAQKLSCTVTASNAGGSASATSANVVVAKPGTLNCPKPSGRLHGTKLGPLALGFTSQHARRVLRRVHKGKGTDDFCLYAGWGIRVEYPSPKLLAQLSAKERRWVRDRIVLELTSNPFYAFNGVRPGLTLAFAQHRLHLAKKIHLASGDWYFATGKAANLVLKVRNGIIYELGIADKRLSSGRASQLRLLRGLPAG